jgi:hypothetical protein
MHEELTGIKFGRLTAISRAENGPAGQTRWLCRCECGALRTVVAGKLKAGLSKSCGCYKRDLSRKRGVALGKLSYKHGNARFNGKRSKEYATWIAMRSRCYNPNNTRFADYGGRGVTVCDRWNQSFSNFLADMGTKPTADHSIDRIDNLGHYGPDNCKWSTRSEQQRNKSTSVWVLLDGASVPLVVASKKLGVSDTCLRNKLDKYPNFASMDARTWGPRMKKGQMP